MTMKVKQEISRFPNLDQPDKNFTHIETESIPDNILAIAY